LVETYTSPAEIDIARDRNLDIIRSRLDGVKTRLGQLEAREKDLNVALASYKGKPAPAVQVEPRQGARRQGGSAGEPRALPEDYDQTQAQFEADKKRWIEMKAAAK
jgi:hypothetical protein